MQASTSLSISIVIIIHHQRNGDFAGDCYNSVATTEQSDILYTF